MNRAVVAARDVAAVLDEEWPTGTYGGRRPGPCPHPNPHAAAHRQALADALADWTCGTTAELRDRAESSTPPSQPTTEKRKQ
ncbi:hypothetical protein SFUL_3689 [Streptomyces microflavus DSM 40593]|uniref:Uncharacterized protein n=1 Tax=Streptomyces microflavus DSM 40593 TaxID=1303692 RepID=N0D053_STRMI|nr:hypothetical protein SFUL_3689 [Streptomyces microflavus DSM 40593]